MKRKELLALVEFETMPPVTSGYYVYELKDPRTGLAFYVGKGTKYRCLDHIERKDTDRNRLKIKTIDEIITSGSKVVVNCVSSHSLAEDAFSAEIGLISAYGRIGRDVNGILTNITPGGDGGPDNTGVKQSRETIKKRVAKLKGTGKCSNKGTENGMWGRAHSDAAKNAVALANKGRKHSRKVVDANTYKKIMFHAVANELINKRVISRLKSGVKCKDICAELAISHDVVTKLKKEKHRAIFFNALINARGR